jgi:nucleoside-diphosphate-sugar epimerase
MRIVITGATGNVGSRLVPQLLSRPEVTSVVGIARRLPVDPDPQVEWHAMDIAEDDVRPVLDGADVVVHLAWLLVPAHDPDEMHRVNVVGSQRVFDAAVAAGVPAVVHASSIGAYSPGPKRKLPESHPTGGVASSTYSRHKAAAERMLDRLEEEHPERRVVRIRPGVILQAAAASEVSRYFLGPYIPQSLVRRSLVPVLPLPRGLALQGVHTSDIAKAFALACVTPVSGAFNVAAEPVLDGPSLARALHARWVPVPAAALRALVALAWRAHLVPVDPGWIDMGMRLPLMDTTRARSELGWQPEVDALDAVGELLDALPRGAGGTSPVMAPRASGPARLLEVARGLIPGAGGTG